MVRNSRYKVQYTKRERAQIKEKLTPLGKLLPQKKGRNVGGDCQLTTGKSKGPKRLKNPCWSAGNLFEKIVERIEKMTNLPSSMRKVFPVEFCHTKIGLGKIHLRVENLR